MRFDFHRFDRSILYEDLGFCYAGGHTVGNNIFFCLVNYYETSRPHTEIKRKIDIGFGWDVLLRCEQGRRVCVF